MYNRNMQKKFELTPKVFEQIKADYKKALEERRQIIIRQSKEMSQREISRYWDLDPARIYRIIKSQEGE